MTYLKRIGYAGPLEPTFDTLAAIVGLHVRAIPFENLDVLLGRPPRRDLPALRGKLVDSQRGGYCYEHASLCAAELEALGFTVARHSARVVMVTPREQAPRTIVSSRFITLTRPAGVNARSISRCTNGDCGHVAV